MEKHYTAWLTTSRDSLETDEADVTVLRDEYAGERPGANGEPVIEWTSVGHPLFHAVTGLRHDTDIEQLAAKAIELLGAAGWTVTGGDWDAVDTGLVIAVAPQFSRGDRVEVDADQFVDEGDNTGVIDSVYTDDIDGDTVSVHMNDGSGYIAADVDKITVLELAGRGTGQ